MPAPNEPPITVDTVTQLLTNSLVDAGVIGVDEAIEPVMLNRAFTQLNWLLATWARKRFLDYRIQDYAIVSNGSMTYPVGTLPAGTAGVNLSPRPDRLEYAFLRFLNSPQPTNLPVDIPIRIIQSHEDYSRIRVKNIGSIAWRIFYDPDWPLGTLFPWPVPQATIYEIHVGFKVIPNRFHSLQDKINLPPEYEAAMNWCLARRLRTSYQMPADPEINSIARDALNSIRLANQAVGVLELPAFLRGRNVAYDYRGDST